MFYSIRIDENRDTWYLVADHTCSDALNVIDLINLSIIERKCGAIKKTPRWIHQSLLLRKVNLTLIFSSALTIRETIK